MNHSNPIQLKNENKRFTRITRITVASFLAVLIPCVYWNIERGTKEYLYADVYRLQFLHEYVKDNSQTNLGGYNSPPSFVQNSDPPSLMEYEAFLKEKSLSNLQMDVYFSQALDVHRQAKPTLSYVKSNGKYLCSIHFHWLFGGTETFECAAD